MYELGIFVGGLAVGGLVTGYIVHKINELTWRRVISGVVMELSPNAADDLLEAIDRARTKDASR